MDRIFATKFPLNPDSCTTAEDVNFAEDCSRKEDSTPTPPTPNQIGLTGETALSKNSLVAEVREY